MKEKEPIAGGQDYGKDEDSSEALLKKHEAMITDLEAFQATVESLRQQANQCSVSGAREGGRGAAVGVGRYAGCDWIVEVIVSELNVQQRWVCSCCGA